MQVYQRLKNYIGKPLKNAGDTEMRIRHAFSNAAQLMAPLRRIEMERFAGTLLEAPLQ